MPRIVISVQGFDDVSVLPQQAGNHLAEEHAVLPLVSQVCEWSGVLLLLLLLLRLGLLRLGLPSATSGRGRGGAGALLVFGSRTLPCTPTDASQSATRRHSSNEGAVKGGAAGEPGGASLNSWQGKCLRKEEEKLVTDCPP
jgi:hypothetical protein